MKKLPFKIIDLCRKYRKTGFSHRDIVGKVKISLGSVFKYTKDIKLTEEQHLTLKRRNLPKVTLVQRRIGGSHSPNKYQPKFRKRDLINFIINFYKQTGRIPTKKEVSSHKPYVRIFGSWNNAIKEAGFRPNPIKFARKHISLDGHKCDSFAELIIDNWLYQNHIPHKIHVVYPGTPMSSDFLVDNIRIEFIGLAGELKKYDNLLKRKRKFIKTQKLNVIEIYPYNLFPKNNLDQILKSLLKT